MQLIFGSIKVAGKSRTSELEKYAEKNSIKKKSVSSNLLNDLLLHGMIGGFYLSQITAHQH